MIHKRYTFALAALLAMVFFVGQQSAFSQNDQGAMKEMARDSTHQHGTTMSHPMNQEMSQVRSECQKADRSAGTALTEIRTAKSSNDPKVLKDALDKAEKQLSEIQSSMSSAMKMMSTTHSSEHMQGGTQTEKDRMRGNAMDSTMKAR